LGSTDLASHAQGSLSATQGYGTEPLRGTEFWIDLRRRRCATQPRVADATLGGRGSDSFKMTHRRVGAGLNTGIDHAPTGNAPIQAESDSGWEASLAFAGRRISVVAELRPW
jgi:hypothetical protein